MIIGVPRNGIKKQADKASFTSDKTDFKPKLIKIEKDICTNQKK